MTDGKIKLIKQKSNQPKEVATVMNLKVQYGMTRSKSIVLFFFHLEAGLASNYGHYCISNLGFRFITVINLILIQESNPGHIFELSELKCDCTTKLKVPDDRTRI